MRYSPIPSKLFSDRRKAFLKQMEKDSIAILYSNDLMRRSADQYYPYRQDPTLFSLTGVDQGGTILLLDPSGKKSSEILFLLPDDPKNVIWNGKRLSKKEASSISGINSIATIDDFEKTLKDLNRSKKMIYVNSAENELTSKRLDGLSKKYPSAKIVSSDPIRRQLAMVKHPVEIDLIKKAVDITGQAFEKVLQKVKPGMKEYEVEAELTYFFTKNGCRHAFEPIIASGNAATTLHYITNDRTIQSGALILMDFGAEYANMASDMSRTIPANGKFSKEQKRIYLSVLYVLNEITQMMQPGVTLKELNAETGKLIESELIRLRIVSKKEIKQQNKKKPLWKKYFMHGVSHHLGYDVHDLSDKEASFKPGMVLTCEPGLYIPKLNLGIRLENDIVITKAGPRNLMAHIPIDPEEIESIMNSRT